VTPGLIDLHNHLAYNTLPLWVGRTEPYTTRYQWPRAATYQRDVSNPAQALGIAAPAAALRFAEVKAVVGGVTAIQGSPTVTRAFPGWMLRNIEKEQFGTGQRIYQSVLPASGDALDAASRRLADGRTFVYHLAEGTGDELRAEFTMLDDHACVRDGLVGIHATSLTGADFATWRDRGGGAIVWSPFSNLWLYGGTTDVIAAREAGLRVCLGSDWTPSGTRNVLGELKVAKRWNTSALGGRLSALELVEMVTANPGDTLAAPWQVTTGRLVPQALADLAVFAPLHSDPYVSVLRANERHVRLVVIGGRAAYGNRSLLRAAGQAEHEVLRVRGVTRGIVMGLPDHLLPGTPDLDRMATMSWEEGLRELRTVWADPATAVRRARRSGDGLEFIPDLPSEFDPNARRLDDDELDELVMPTFDGIGHGTDWTSLLRSTCPAHAPLLLDVADDLT
jgi:cytosine/adenosine deaminase-related metal-dependent hydrolase